MPFTSEPAFIPYNIATIDPLYGGQFGDYWRTEFSYRFFYLDGNISRYAITFPNGAVEYFSSGLVQTSHLYKNGVLRSDSEGFVYQVDDLTLTFTHSGFLKYYERVGSQKHSLHYSGFDFEVPIFSTLPDGRPGSSVLPDGLLKEIRDVNNQIVYKFSYDASGRVIFIDHGNERLFYEYDNNDNLIKVSRSDASSRQYLYENTVFRHALTSIVDETGINYAAWSYDSSGRAISSSHSGATEAVSLDFSQVDNASDPRVSVTNPLGKQATYHFGIYQGIRRVKSIEGHASANCAAANRSYDYDPNGTLKSKTDWSGNITTYERDEFGREISRTEAAGTPEARTITTEYHPTLNRPVRIAEPGRIEVMTYDEQGQLISRVIHSAAVPAI